MALLPTSAAIDAGDDVWLNARSAADRSAQFAAEDWSHVDIGAIEYEPPQPGPNYVVTPRKITMTARRRD